MRVGPGGAVAQLGERLNGIQEVRGSIPLGSTGRARVAELVDAQDSGSCGGNPVRVRVPPRAFRRIVWSGTGRSDRVQVRPVVV